jgi:hypothetical protein
MDKRRYAGIARHLQHPTQTYRALRSYEILRVFESRGYPVKESHPIPPDLSAEIYIQDVLVKIRPKTKKGMEKRVFAVCPDCEREVEAGHLHQHTQAMHP